MPLSTFDGETSEALHEHYDADGNLTGTTVVVTPGWSDTDRAWALALAQREAAQCPRGHDLADSLDPQWRWEMNDPAVCLACVAMDEGAKRYEKHPQHRAMLHSVRKVPRPKKRQRGG